MSKRTPAPMPAANPPGSKSRKFEKQVLLAIIPVVGTILVGYWAYNKANETPKSVRLAIVVKDKDTGKGIPYSTVTLQRGAQNERLVTNDLGSKTVEVTPGEQIIASASADHYSESRDAFPAPKADGSHDINLGRKNDPHQLKSAVVTFVTGKNGKRGSSVVSIKLRRQKTLFATHESVLGGNLQTGTTHREELSIEGLTPFSASDVDSSTLELAMTTHPSKKRAKMDPENAAHDSWRFDFTLRLTFYDDTTQDLTWRDKHLTEVRRESLPLKDASSIDGR